jgi:CMP-N,N'-diacetyllegionaminic acid synthase
VSAPERSTTPQILGLIPARGGSKGILQKNIAPLAGRPLLAYTCEAALGSKYLTRVVLSTDDEQIANVGRRCGVEIPFMRPAEFARDDTSSMTVVLHTLNWFSQNEDWQPDFFVLLQPTSPLRRSHHIDEALAALIQADADTIVSVCQVPHHFSPYKIMQLEGSTLHNFWKEPLPFDTLSRHNLPVLYARNGPAVLATRVSVILAHQTFYGQNILPYIMSEKDSVDIDTPYDLRMAEWLMNSLE